MLDASTYRTSEQLAKAQMATWRISQTHNVDHFERVGFPVRINSYRDLGQLLDTMQENRFAKYMNELGGLSDAEYELLIDVCCDLIDFQSIYFPNRRAILPISTLLSSFTLFKKMKGINPDFRSVLEVGPGCGYLSLFMRRHAPLATGAWLPHFTWYTWPLTLLLLAARSMNCSALATAPLSTR